MSSRPGGTIATLLVVVCLGCLSTSLERIRTERDLLRAIEASDIAEDHEALAAFYREQERTMEEKAAILEGRAKRYARIPRGGRVDLSSSRALAASHRRMAAEYEALAELHEAHARQLRGQPK